jgi:hypothetical protein
MPASHRCEDNASTPAAQSNQHDGMSATSSLHSHSASVMPASLLSSTVASARADANGNACSSVLYHKKDVTLHPAADDDPVCVRIQIWNVNNSHYNDVSSSNACHSNTPMMISSLLQKCHGFVLAIRAPSRCSSNQVNGSSNSTVASASMQSAYYSYSETNTYNHWPALDTAIEQIEGWFKFLRASIAHSSNKNVLSNILVLLTDDEEDIVANYSPRNWMELSRRMETVCRDNSITNNSDENNDTVDMIGWRLVSSRSSIDCEFNTYNEAASNHSFFKRLKEEQVRMQQDMVDAVELAFVELIQSYLRSKCL